MIIIIISQFYSDELIYRTRALYNIIQCPVFKEFCIGNFTNIMYYNIIIY